MLLSFHLSIFFKAERVIFSRFRWPRRAAPRRRRRRHFLFAVERQRDAETVSGRACSARWFTRARERERERERVRGTRHAPVLILLLLLLLVVAKKDGGESKR